MVIETLPALLALTHEQRLDRLVELARRKAALAAEEQVLLYAVAAGAPDVGLANPKGYDGYDDKDWISDEVAAVLRIAARTAGAHLATAERLVTVFPDTITALGTGRISFPHALRLSEATINLTDDQAQRVEAAVLVKAERQTPGQFRHTVTKAVARVDTRHQAERHQAATAGRRVWCTPQPDGMSELGAHLPAHEAAAIMDQLHTVADQTAEGDERTADQRRADALVDLVLGQPSDTRATVNVTVALSTVAALDEAGGELAGHGAIPAELARLITREARTTWRPILTDHAGCYLAAGARTYRPSAALDRHIRQRDRTCRFPGCRTKAERCEVDHIVAWADGGLTVPENLHCLCKRHHHLKHETRWRVKRNADGSTEWTSPSGRIYVQPPPDPLPVDTSMLEPAPF